jgi:hypothetical protein
MKPCRWQTSRSGSVSISKKISTSEHGSVNDPVRYGCEFTLVTNVARACIFTRVDASCGSE